MSWLSALVALVRVLAAIFNMASDAQAQGAGRAEAIAEASNHALDLIAKARDALVLFEFAEEILDKIAPRPCGRN